ncbi:uncharacterized protein OCT59_026030 [Rhizophagus irregularis]|uniref:uncharacterized protein n=1 Tax=Rhizophagus irregularis TaxID=588596 RepID=UPI000CC39A34|nr:hypothetical protein OCT59_026030 [Rhizophagus irregularis]
MKRKDIKLTIENIYAVAEGEETATHVDFKERFGENEEHSEGEFTDETYRSESSEEDENSEEDSILSEISFKLIVNQTVLQNGSLFKKQFLEIFKRIE